MLITSAPNFMESKTLFLELPVEIRRLVYSHFIPDASIRAYRHPTLEAEARKDGGSSSPALLRVNRKIYNELSIEWYSQALFKACLRKYHDGGYSIKFLSDTFNQGFNRGDQLSQRFQYVKNLELTICFKQPSAYTPRNELPAPSYQHSIDLLVALVSLLSAPEARLENLSLIIEIPIGLIVRMRSDPELIPELFEFRLHPLRSLRGLKHVTFETKNQAAWGERMGGPKKPSLDVDSWSAAYLDPLCKEIMEPKFVVEKGYLEV